MSIQSNFPNLQPSLLLDFANTKQLDNRVTFTRSTPAVYYDGKTTAMAEQNLILQSQTIGNAGWLLVNTALVSDAGVAPDGTTTADQLTFGSGKMCYQTVSWPSGAFGTVTIYVKAAATSSAAFFKFATNNTASWNTGLQSPKVALTSSWQRVTLSGILQNGGGGINIHIDGSNTADGVVDPDCYGNVLVWGVQINTYTTETAYIATTTQPITNYIPVLLSAGGNQARFDHNPTTGESLGLLIEEARTNIATYSSVNTSGWVSISSTLTNNYATGPDGTTSAGYLADDTNNVQHSLYQTVTLANATSYSFSAYIKSYGRNYAEIIPFGTPTGNTVVGASFNLSNGTVSATTGAVTATITSVGNGWYRCSVIYTTVASGAANFNIFPSNGPNIGDRTYTGNGFSGLLVWGAQCEAGAFATSYIATTSASATRTADAASMTGTNFSSWFQPQQGSLYFETSYLKSGTRSPFQFGSSASNRYSFYTSDATLNYYDGGVSFTTSFSNTSSKIACSLVNYDIAVAFNNATASSIPSGKALLNVDKFTIGSAYYGGEYICGTIKKMAYYPLRLSNTNLQALTS